MEGEGRRADDLNNEGVRSVSGRKAQEEMTVK